MRVFVEYDRTRRVDKNYDKFLRYETHAADVELTGHLSARTEAGHEEHYHARDRTLSS